jgi:hypothetical protein
MKKLHLLLVALFLIGSTGTTIFAQSHPYEFRMPLFVEDAFGHRDSVMIGYDSTLALQPADLDPSRGEIAINTPFDSVFEVRVRREGSNVAPTPFSKTVITSFEGNCINGGGSGAIKLYIYSKNYPVTISWDSHLLNQPYDPCKGESLLFETTEFAFAPPMYPLDATILNRTSALVYPTVANPYKETVQIVGGGQAQAFIPLIIFGTHGIFVIPTKNVKEPPLAIQLFPNPATGIVSIALPPTISRAQVQVCDIVGRVVHTATLGNTPELDLRGLPTGAYIVQVYDGADLLATQKLILLQP